MKNMRRTIPNRTNMKKDNSGKEASFCTGKGGKRTVLEIKSERFNSGKEASQKKKIMQQLTN